VVSQEALKAKEELDDRKATQVTDDAKKVPKQLAIVEEFNHSVRLLTAIFHQSKFDELVMLISSPVRVLVINFLIGLLRGMGFLVGLLLVLLILVMMFREVLSTESIRLFQSLWLGQ
jgi:hypothetical protein